MGYIAVILVITFLIVRFVGVRTEVIGTSMTPTLQDGDNLIVEKVSYYFTDPQRYDIIVFPYPEDPGKHYIKRIIGLPGETVQIIDGYVYIDGELLMNIMATRLWKTRALPANQLFLAMMSTLSLETTGIIVRTADILLWEI